MDAYLVQSLSYSSDSEAKLVVVIVIASLVYQATIKPFGIHIPFQICFHHLKVNQPFKYSELKGIIILQADDTQGYEFRQSYSSPNSYFIISHTKIIYLFN